MKVVRPAVALTLAALAIPLCPQHTAASQTDARFSAELVTALSKSDVPAFRRLCLPSYPASTRWITNQGGFGSKTSAWQIGYLDLPVPIGQERRLLTASMYHMCEDGADHLFKVAETPDGMRLRDEIPETDVMGWRIRDHRLNVRFSVSASRVQIDDEAAVERRPDAAATLVFRLNAIYKVESVLHKGKSLPFVQSGGFVAVAPPEGRRFALKLAYSAELRGSAEDFIQPREMALTSYWYPHTGRMPARSTVTITVPSGWSAIAPGELVSRTPAPAGVVYTWRNEVPICYITMAAGKYTISTRQYGGVTVAAYLLDANAARAQSTIKTAADALLWFSKNFSKYPYTRYAVVESSTFSPGAALEVYSFTLCSAISIPGAVPHEVSHTWWGGVVPNTYTRSLWNESLASYSDALYHRMTGPAKPEDLSAAGFSPANSATPSLLEANDATSGGDSSVGYGKGSLVMTTLEQLVGPRKVIDILSRFIAAHPVGEDAEWRDIVSASVDVLGPSWKGFYTDWLARHDVPSLELAGVSSRPIATGGYVVTGTVKQAGTRYWLKAPLSVRTDRGTVAASIVVRDTSTPFSITVPGKPTHLSLDPKRRLLRAVGGTVERPALSALHGVNGPLLVIYGAATAGAAAADLRNAASSNLALAMPFAEITVKADDEVTDADLAGASVLLIGRPDQLRLPKPIPSFGPLRFAADAISAGPRRSWSQEGVWGMAVAASPWKDGAVVALAAGLGANALTGLSKQGDLSAGHSFFVVGPDGKALWSSAESTQTEVDLTASK